MNTIRLIIITVLPAEVSERVQWIRAPLCEKYQASWALTYPPHVTLRTGVKVPEDHMRKFLSDFESIMNGCTPFTIHSEKARHSFIKYEGEQKFFLYLPVVEDDALMQLNRRLLTYQPYKKSNKKTFHPHVTLLLDHLTVKEQEEVKVQIAEDKRFHECFEWTCDNVSLYVKNRNQWVPFHTYKLL